jgi:hypothetical protein
MKPILLEKWMETVLEDKWSVPMNTLISF